jgi:spore coat protein CotF
MKVLPDKFMLQDILAHLRDLMTQSGMTIQHANCPNVRDVVTKTSGRTTANQFELFKFMNERGLYPIKNVTDTELRECIKMHTQNT